jgi:hypothetical protein
MIFGWRRNKWAGAGLVVRYGLVAKQLHGSHGNFARGFAELLKADQRNKEETFTVYLLGSCIRCGYRAWTGVVGLVVLGSAANVALAAS